MGETTYLFSRPFRSIFPDWKTEISTERKARGFSFFHRRDNRVSFLTLNSPNPADPVLNDTIGGENAMSSTGFRARMVWSRSAQEMLDHVTRDWRNHYVTADILSYEELQTFVIRPFVLVVRLDAPILERFRRLTRYSISNSFFSGIGIDPYYLPQS